MAFTTVTVSYPDSINDDADSLAEWLEEVARQIRQGMTCGHVSVNHHWDSEVTK